MKQLKQSTNQLPLAIIYLWALIDNDSVTKKPLNVKNFHNVHENKIARKLTKK